MNINVRLFAIAKELAECEILQVNVSEPCTVDELRRAIAQQSPAIAPIVAQLMIAVDEEYATGATVIGPRATVACIPPVSGG